MIFRTWGLLMILLIRKVQRHRPTEQGEGTPRPLGLGILRLHFPPASGLTYSINPGDGHMGSDGRWGLPGGMVAVTMATGGRVVSSVHPPKAAFSFPFSQSRVVLGTRLQC